MTTAISIQDISSAYQFLTLRTGNRIERRRRVGGPGRPVADEVPR